MRKERDLIADSHPSGGIALKHEDSAIMAVEQALQEAERMNTSLSLILCDVDHLEAINAIHGRAAGDALLLQLFVRVCEFVPVEDVVWESERADLVIIARNHSYADAYHLAETIRQSVSSELFHVAQQPLMVTVSLGSRSVVPDRWTTAEEVLGITEDQLELSKRLGPNAIAPTIN